MVSVELFSETFVSFSAFSLGLEGFRASRFQGFRVFGLP